MPPFDWHEIPKKADIDRRFSQIDARFSQVDARLDAQTDVICRRMDEGFRDLRVEMAGMRKEMRTILLALVGFMLSVVLGVMTTGIALAAG